MLLCQIWFQISVLSEAWINKDMIHLNVIVWAIVKNDSISCTYKFLGYI